MMSGTIFKRDRRWKIKRSLVNLTKDRLAARTKNGEIPIPACYEQETELDYVAQTKYTQELINRMVLPIHYDVKTSFNHLLLCEEIIWYIDCKRKSLVARALFCAWMKSKQGVDLEKVLNEQKIRTLDVLWMRRRDEHARVSMLGKDDVLAFVSFSCPRFANGCKYQI